MARTRRLGLPLFALALAASPGCASLFDRVSYLDMEPRLVYQGFSFDRPPNVHWFLRRSESSHTRVLLRRETPDSSTHTFYARVGLTRLPREPESYEEFARLARFPAQRGASYSVEETAYAQERATVQGLACIRFDAEFVVHGAPPAPERELRMVIRGFRCPHPTFPDASVDFFYSERGLPAEVGGGLVEEGETFLRGVRIDVAPGEPAGPEHALWTEAS